MKVGDIVRIRAVSPEALRLWPSGLVIRIGFRHNNRRVATVLTDQGLQTWPMDSHYEYEVLSESS